MRPLCLLPEISLQHRPIIVALARHLPTRPSAFPSQPNAPAQLAFVLPGTLLFFSTPALPAPHARAPGITLRVACKRPVNAYRGYRALQKV